MRRSFGPDESNASISAAPLVPALILRAKSTDCLQIGCLRPGGHEHPLFVTNASGPAFQPGRFFLFLSLSAIASNSWQSGSS